ncbi:MAG: hypothetical protein VXZ54_04715 [Planctomycetota bacterium]|jgi:Tfp pilus assembly PilM family ATPase|nr:hypothetical protein [Planctomycetota bacterium]MEE3075159.1 hypothetical protein [Planctomycetota bacterium]
MASTIILQWDAARIRAAVGTASANSPSVQKVVAFDLSSGGDTDEVMTMADTIAAGLKEQKVGKGDAVVVVDRSTAELRVLSVPPVPDDELPDIVRFQANREFTSVSEGWLIDFISLPSSPNGQRRVLAGAISPQVAAQIRGACDTAGLNLKKVILRPFASGSLLSKAGMLQEDCVLIEMLGDAADLTVYAQGELQLTRSIRLSAEASEEALIKQMQLELKRTLTSFQNQQHDAAIKRVILMAPESLAGSLEKELAEGTGLQCLSVDPWSVFKNIGSAKRQVPADSEQLGAVLGGLCTPAGDFSEIDFVNPTRPPAPPSNRRRNVLIAATAATLLASVGGLYWVQSSQLDAQLTQLQQEVAKMGREDQTHQDRLKEIEMLENWVGNRPNWLAEMGEMSQDFPLPDDAIVDNLGLALDEKNQLAVIKITGKASSAEAIRRLETELRDPEAGREISGRQNSPTAGGPYKFRFDETLTVELARATGADSDESVEVSATEINVEEIAGDEVTSEETESETPVETQPVETQPVQTQSDETESDEEAGKEEDEDEAADAEQTAPSKGEVNEAESNSEDDENPASTNQEVEVEPVDEGGSSDPSTQAEDSDRKTAEGEDDA